MAGAREKVLLVSTGLTKSGNKTGTFYSTTKAKKGENAKKKIEKIKFDPRAYDQTTNKNKMGMHVLFKEGKLDKNKK